MALQAVVQNYLALKQAEAEATKAKKAAEAELRQELAQAGIDNFTVDGVLVKVVEAVRVSYDATTLSQMVKPTILKKVTKVVVDNELMESAIKMGLIDEQVAATVSVVTPYSQVRVTPVSAEAKAKKQGIAKAS
ncbi:MAG: hypothetical protein EBU84_02030 [Actinobacteria bacterium]|jgi:hypothetical protein|nr:hypothetical protein [Actinomycetota bacterium]